MGMSTLNDIRVTAGRITIPKWGCWHAEVSLDGEHSLTGSVTLKIADATFVGTVLSGGPMKGRSTYRIVAGAGGWGRTIKRESYADDSNTKVSKVVGDAAALVGETVETTSSDRTGPNFTRPEGPASTVLQLVAPRAWYVDEAGVTRLGARSGGSLVGQVTRIAPVDLARGKLMLAAELISTILPGTVVDGLTAVDVEHTISADGGLRTTLFGAQQNSAPDSFLALLRQVDPSWRFRGLTEYRVGQIEGTRLSLQPVLTSSEMPDLRRVPVRPGVPGCSAEVALGTYVLVGFVNADEARPVVVSFADEDHPGFQPATLTMRAGGQSGGEHVATVEGVLMIIHNLFAELALAQPGPWTGAVIQAALVAAINAAIAVAAAPAPPGLAAQITAAAALGSTMAAGNPGATSAPYASALEALATKTPNVSGLFPSVGCAAVEAG